MAYGLLSMAIAGRVIKPRDKEANEVSFTQNGAAMLKCTVSINVGGVYDSKQGKTVYPSALFQITIFYSKEDAERYEKSEGQLFRDQRDFVEDAIFVCNNIQPDMDIKENGKFLNATPRLWGDKDGNAHATFGGVPKGSYQIFPPRDRGERTEPAATNDEEKRPLRAPAKPAPASAPVVEKKPQVSFADIEE